MRESHIYTNDDDIIEGEIEEGKIYKETDFNKKIEIREREAERVKIYLDEVNQKEKAIIFCANQAHAAVVRDLVNQYKTSKNPNYCVRVTANDGERGEQFLRKFQDNEKSIPTVLTTSQKLSTGVDARNIRNIVLMRPINSMIEFKQIVGRGTRLFEGKDFFTIYDYVDAHHHFADPEWDGEPMAQVCSKCGENPCICEKLIEEEEDTYYEPEAKKVCAKCGQSPCICIKKVKIKLADGKVREIQHMIATSFWNADGKPISTEEFLTNLFGQLPNFFKSEDELRTIWSNPATRKTLLASLDEAGFGDAELRTLQKLINAENSDLYDVLEYVFNGDVKPISRVERVHRAEASIFAMLDDKQRDFIDFILSKYIESGVNELDEDKLSILLQNKYMSLEDAKDVLGSVPAIRSLFIDFQKYLYLARVV